jgi:hypothetical protein
MCRNSTYPYILLDMCGASGRPRPTLWWRRNLACIAFTSLIILPGSHRGLNIRKRINDFLPCRRKTRWTLLWKGVDPWRKLPDSVSKVSEAAESLLTESARRRRPPKASWLSQQGVGDCRKSPDSVSKVSEAAESFLTQSAGYRQPWNS